jgi:hypothetical protein
VTQPSSLRSSGRTYVSTHVVPFAQLPRQLTRAIADFTGRQTELHHLQELIRSGRSQSSESPIICAVSGKPGVGKSAFVAKLAQSVAQDFPDGQLYINLQGPEQQSLEPSQVLAMFLQALAVPGQSIPDTREEREVLYRSRVDDKAILIVLDNAADEAQVRPLIPANPQAAVLITSRAQLTVLEGAHLLNLEVLDVDVAIELLETVSDRTRVAASREAARTVVELCGLLPLAIRVAGARLRGRPNWTIDSLAERLSDEHRRLDELAAGDLEVRASFALSYRGLRDHDARLFRSLSLLTGPDFTAEAAAKMIATTLPMAEQSIERLLDSQLLEPSQGSNRYQYHDLLRLFARERAAEESKGGRRKEVQRVLKWYRDASHIAISVLNPIRHKHLRSSMKRDEASTWLETESRNLVAAVQLGYDLELWEETWRLADIIAEWYSLRAIWKDWQSTSELALEAARSAGDRSGEGRILLHLGDIATM